MRPRQREGLRVFDEDDVDFDEDDVDRIALIS